MQRNIGFLSGKDIIMVSTDPMSGAPVWRSKQQFALRLSRNNRVLYVEPPIWFLTRTPSVPLKKLAATVFNTNPRHNDSLFFLFPPAIPGGDRGGSIMRANASLLAKLIRSRARGLGFRDPILWIYDFRMAGLTGRLGESLSMYYCVDEWPEFPWADREKVTEQEAALCRRVDTVLATAHSLRDRLSAHNPRCRYVPNAADVELFSKTALPDTAPDPGISALPGPRIGFIGAFEQWLDSDLIAATATARPGWSFVFTGKIGFGNDVSQLQKIPNIHFTGHRPADSLPSCIKAFDVCSIPFRINRLTNSVSPLKLFEYMASGKPIVSTAIREALEYPGLVYSSNGPDDFIAQCERALAEPPAAAVERMQASLSHTWEARINEIGKILEEAKASK